jgi:hypothetical protein
VFRAARAVRRGPESRFGRRSNFGNFRSVVFLAR